MFSGIYVHTKPALFTRSLSLLQKMLPDSQKKHYNLQHRCMSESCRHQISNRTRMVAKISVSHIQNVESWRATCCRLNSEHGMPALHMEGHLPTPYVPDTVTPLQLILSSGDNKLNRQPLWPNYWSSQVFTRGGGTRSVRTWYN